LWLRAEDEDLGRRALEQPDEVIAGEPDVRVVGGGDEHAVGMLFFEQGLEGMAEGPSAAHSGVDGNLLAGGRLLDDAPLPDLFGDLAQRGLAQRLKVLRL
jgi:hypothetical protein